MYKSRVLIVAPIYAPYPGGGANYFPRLTNCLSQTKKVTVLTEYHKDCAISERHDNAKIMRLFPRRDSKYPLTYINSGMRLIITFIILYLYVIAWSFKNYRKEKIIIITRYYFRPVFYFFKIYKKIFRCKLVIDYRTSVDEFIAKRIDANFFDITFCNSLSCYNQTLTHQNMVGKAHHYIPNAIQLQTKTCRHQETHPQRTSVFVGTLSNRKGFDIVIKAQQILQREQNLKPIIIGRAVDYDENYIRKYLTCYTYFESLPHSALIQHLQSAGVVLLPSRREGLPRVAIEALCFHGRIVLPPCCEEFSKLTFSLSELSVGSVVKQAKSVIKDEVKYDVNLHNWEQQYAKYLAIIDGEAP